MTEQKSFKYISFGSPLVDFVCEVEDGFLEKIGLQNGSTQHKDLEHNEVFQEFKDKPTTEKLLGGCQFNAMRIFNWMIQKDKNYSLAFVGSVGEDEVGDIYKNKLIEENITPLFETIKDMKSGRCLVMCHGIDRGHFTDLGASIKISKSYIEKHWTEISGSKLIYTELYILADQKEITYKLAELGCSDDKIYGFNLPSFGFLKAFIDDISKLVSYADLVFANLDEGLCFLEVLGQRVERNSKIVVEKIAELEKFNKNKPRIVVITNGPEEAWVCKYNPKTGKVEFLQGLLPFDVSKIVDSNGAGDSFAGGFMSQLMSGESLENCIIAGHWAARHVIERIGFQFDKQVKFTMEEAKNSYFENQNSRKK